MIGKSNRRRSRKSSVTRFNAEFSRSENMKLSVWQRIRRFTALIVAVSILGVAGFFLLFAELSVDGALPAIDNEIVKTGDTVFIPAFDSAAVVNRLKTDYREDVSDVDIRHEWWNRRLLITIEPRRPSLILRTGDSSYYLDREGIVIEAVADETLESLPLLDDLSSLETDVGQQAIPSSLASFIIGLDKSDLEFSKLRIIDTTSEIYAELNDGYDARFATGYPLEPQLENLSRVQALSEQSGKPIREYVDLRIPYKAYYK